jgi:hypothetical protein
MTPYPEDSQITAYVLGELDMNEAAEIERAAVTDPVIRRKITEARDIQQFLKRRLSPPLNQLHPSQRDNIRRNARLSPHKRASVSRGLPRWILPSAAAAAVILLALFMMLRKSDSKPAVIVNTTNTPVPPLSKVIEEPAAPPPQPIPTRAAIANSGFLAAIDHPTLDLPTLPGKKNLSSLAQRVRGASQDPPRDAVRIEEILNSFPLRLHGMTAIARSPASNWHPDKRDDGISSHLATLSTEMISCPWNPSATLLLVSTRINGPKDCGLKITFHLNVENVIRYRLLGFNPEQDKTTTDFPTQLPAGAYSTLAIEIESSKPASELGSLRWSIDGVASPPISLIHKADAEPSDDARFATLVCAYAMWLAGDYAGGIDREILSALVRENTSVTDPEHQAELIRMIEDSLLIQKTD